MFYKFNAHRSAPLKKEQDPADHSARKIFQSLLRAQRRWAGFMQKQSEKLSQGWLKALCLTVLTASFTYSTYLLFDGILSLPKVRLSTPLERLWRFDPSGLKASARKKAGFELYLDSLQKAVTQDSLKQTKTKQQTR